MEEAVVTTDATEKKEGSENFDKLIVPVLWLLEITDLFSLILFLTNIGVPCDVSLGSWAFGAFFLGSPVTNGSILVKRYYGQIVAIFYELVAFAAAFAWLAWGTVQINISDTCQHTAPVLWWSVFVIVTFSWCSTIGLIISLTLLTAIQQLLSWNKTKNPTSL